MVEDSFLTQTVTQPTGGDDTLELVLTSDPDLISDCKVDEKLDPCDPLQHKNGLGIHRK